MAHKQQRSCSWLAASVMLSLMAAAAAAYMPTMDPKASQLSPSVLLMGQFDWKLFEGEDGKPWSRCLDMVWRARRFSTGNRLNFVVTSHWLPGSDGTGVSQFCYLPSSGGCQLWTPAALAEFQQSMTLCLAEALEQGFIPYIRPHLDDGLDRGTWRNGLLFNPTVKYGEYSYVDVMLDPLASAMRDALTAAAAAGNLSTAPDKRRPTVYMGLQGEMSATIMRYTSTWASLIPAIRSTIGDQHADVKIGIGLNFNRLDAVDQPAPEQRGLFGALAPSRLRRAVVPQIDGAAVKDLVTNKIDFVGISAYAPFSARGFADEFENSAFNVGDSLTTLAGGVCLSCLAASGKVELHYSEFGIGCGNNNNGAAAVDVDQCARQPWAGVSGTYTTSRDPWQRADFANFRGRFFSQVLGWLSSGPSTKTYHVNEVFVWSVASWDVWGVYPDSNSSQGSYRDDALVHKIAHHNTAVIASQTCNDLGAVACAEYVQANGACLSGESGAGCLAQTGSSSDATV